MTVAIAICHVGFTNRVAFYFYLLTYLLFSFFFVTLPLGKYFVKIDTLCFDVKMQIILKI